MQRSFPLFQNHLDLSQLLWKKVLQTGDWAIDATCGNGQDTVKLSQIITRPGGIIAIDLQNQAITTTQNTLSTDLEVHFFCQCHSSFPLICQEKTIRLIVYNLGYLPRGNKTITTQVASTLSSVQKALEILQEKGVISITCYPGHAEGACEQIALLELASQLNPRLWNCSHHTWENRKKSPSLLLIQKNSC